MRKKKTNRNILLFFIFLILFAGIFYSFYYFMMPKEFTIISGDCSKYSNIDLQFNKDPAVYEQGDEILVGVYWKHPDTGPGGINHVMGAKFRWDDEAISWDVNKRRSEYPYLTWVYNEPSMISNNPECVFNIGRDTYFKASMLNPSYYDGSITRLPTYPGNPEGWFAGYATEGRILDIEPGWHEVDVRVGLAPSTYKTKTGSIGTANCRSLPDTPDCQYGKVVGTGGYLQQYWACTVWSDFVEKPTHGECIVSIKKKFYVATAEEPIVTVECVSDIDCAEGYWCKNEQCVLEVIEQACISDADCTPGTECINNECVEVVLPTPEEPEVPEPEIPVKEEVKKSFIEQIFSNIWTAIISILKSLGLGA